MISEAAFWMGRDKLYVKQLTFDIKFAATDLLRRVNQLLIDLNMKDFSAVSSGWRPAQINAATPGAATHSAHMIGKAVDIKDPLGKLDSAILARPELLAKNGLAHEDPGSTPGWCHLQSRPLADGKWRTFKV